MKGKSKQKSNGEDLLEEIMKKAPIIRPGFSDALGEVPYTAIRRKDGSIEYVPERSIIVFY